MTTPDRKPQALVILVIHVSAPQEPQLWGALIDLIKLVLRVVEVWMLS